MTALRGVILAGGKGTRLGELTKVTNKHLLPVGPFPMVYHPLKKLTGAGLKEILLVSGTEHMGDFVELLGSGNDHDCRLTYRVQDEAGGIAQALGLAELFCTGARCVVILGDNIFLDSLRPMLAEADKHPDWAWVGLEAGPRPEPLRRRRAGGQPGRQHRGEAGEAEERFRRGRHLRLSAGRVRGDPDAEAERAAANWKSPT